MRHRAIRLGCCVNPHGANVQTFRPRCLPILIGSLPILDHREAARIILEESAEIPLWPQLPKNSKEGMVRQFLTGFPGLIDEGKRFWIDTDCPDFADEMTSFYEDYLRADTDPDFLKTSRFALGHDTTAGFAALLAALEAASHRPVTVKGQITGPITTGIGAKDRHGNSIFYDENLRDMLVKHLSMKGRWQVAELRRLACDIAPIVFIDEPGLVSFGSTALSGISRGMVAEAVGEVIAAIHQEGGLAGVHICANGDWGPALDSGADIISFDAYSYFANIILFRRELMGFINRGGILAWGIIPTGDPVAIAATDSGRLFAKWREQLATLASFGFTEHMLMEQTLIAPSCGTGSLPYDLAMKVLRMNMEVADKCRELLRQHESDR